MKSGKSKYVLFSLIVAGDAFALPTMYPKNKEAYHSFVNSTSSVAIPDSQDPKKIYVLPPDGGQARIVETKLGSANLGFCDSLAKIHQRTLAVADRLSDIEGRLAHAENTANAREKEYRFAKESAAAIASENPSLRQVPFLNERIGSIEEQLGTLNEQLSACIDASSVQCQEIVKQIDELTGERKSIVAELREARSQAKEPFERYMRAERIATAKKEAWEEAYEAYDRTNAQLLKVKNQIGEMYSQFGLLEGGYSTIKYDSSWDENIEEMRRKNPDFMIEKSRTRGAVLFANFLPATTREEYLASLPTVLDYNILGQPYVPGQTNRFLLAAYPSSLSATLRLSLIGACPIKDPTKYNITKDGSGIPTFGIAVTYDYELAFTTKAVFTYNLAKFYKHIEKRGTRGGFFSRKAFHEVLEETWATDTFKAEWKESDPDNTMTDEKRREIEIAIKAELTERVLSLLALGSYDPKLEIKSPPPVPASGATVLGNGLMKTCGGFNIWCSGGSFILKGLGAIFGRSTSTSSVETHLNVTTREVWDREEVRWKPAMTSFVIQK